MTRKQALLATISRVHGYKSKEEWLEFFIKEYNRIHPTSGNEYNSARTKKSPRWQSIAALYEIRKWKDIVSLSSMPIYVKKEGKKQIYEKLILTVSSTSDLEEKYNELMGRYINHD